MGGGSSRQGDDGEWAAETGKRGNPGRLRGNPGGIVSASRVATAHMWPDRLLECKLDTVDSNIESFLSHRWGNIKGAQVRKTCRSDGGSARTMRRDLFNLDDAHIPHFYRFSADKYALSQRTTFKQP